MRSPAHWVKARTPARAIPVNAVHAETACLGTKHGSAQRSARRKNLDIETVLIDEFQVKVPALGEALSSYFGVPYEAFKPDRIKAPDLMKNMGREFCLENQWVPIEDSKDGIVVMTTDPERTRVSKIVNNVYPKSRIVYKVTTNREFVSR